MLTAGPAEVTALGSALDEGNHVVPDRVPASRTVITLRLQWRGRPYESSSP